jgi:hypothetical protein
MGTKAGTKLMPEANLAFLCEILTWAICYDQLYYVDRFIILMCNK